MTTKSFAQAPKPRVAPPADAIAAFERGGPGQDTRTRIPSNVGMVEPTKAAEPTKRLSLDLPISLHRRFKTACSRTDRKMVSEVIAFIEQRTTELENEATPAQ
jgi:hypothetical protein